MDNNIKTDRQQNTPYRQGSLKDIKEEPNTRHTRKYFHNKRKYRNKDKIINKKIKTSHNSKTKNKNIYTKRTDLIQERIKILQLAKKNIEEEEENNKKSPIKSKTILIDQEKENNIKPATNRSTNNEQNDMIFNTLKTEGFNRDNLVKRNIFSKDKYIKKIPIKNFRTSLDNKNPKIFKKYQTSTFFYKKELKKNNLQNKEKDEQYNINTYNNEKEVTQQEKEKNAHNDMDVVGYKTGFVYHLNDKKKEDKKDFDLKEEENEDDNNSNNNKNSYKYIKVNPKKNLHKKTNSIDQNIQNIKTIKVDYNSENHEISSNNKEKELNNIYVPKKIHHLVRGGSQENIHTTDKNNIINTNVIIKNRFKSYKKINNITNKNNNINININNNIKIITYNKKKQYWKMDKKDNIIEIDDKFEDDKFDLFKDNISDISSIESRSNIESETTENNNKLNVYLNNIYKTKSIFHPKLYRKKQNSTIIDKVEDVSKKNSSIAEKSNNNNNNENKNSRNISVPHFVFKKRITRDVSNNKSNLKKNTHIIKNSNNINNITNISNLNIQKNIKIIKNDNEPRFDELVVIEDKLKKIIEGIDNNSVIIPNLCFDFLNYFNESSIIVLIEKLFESKNLKIITISLRYLIFSIVLLYNDCADIPSLEENDKFLIQEIFSLNLQNILHLYEYIISKVKSKDIWANTLKNIIHNYKKLKKKIYSSTTNLYYQSVFDKIKNNTKYIRQIINRILSSSKKSNNKILSFFKELEKKTFNELKNFFIKNIYQQNKTYGYIYPFYLNNDDDNKEFIQEKLNLDKIDSRKKYTLLLGLEETLINLKLDSESESKGTLKLRPGLISFLREIKKYYEIIIFSLCENKIASYLMDSIEKRNKFFDYRLYRENFNTANDEFIIDLNKIDRPLDKIIIISNIPQIYQLHKENAINILSYWEENLKDNALGHLMTILKNIVDEEGDVRELLLKYHDNIINNVTMRYN